MALAHLKSTLPRKIRTALLWLSLVIGVPGTALAAMAVIDQAAIAKLAEQLSELKKQIEELYKIAQAGRDTVNALGKVGQITIPLLNSARLGSQIQRDLKCLLPDFSKLMPGVKLDDASFNSMCETAKLYEDNLWIDPDKLKAIPKWEEREKVVKTIERRRERVLADAAAKGMAAGDVATQQIEKTAKAADELETAAKAATTVNDRMQVVADAQAALLRAQAQTNQLLAILVKIQGAYAMKAGVPIETQAKVDLAQQEGQPK